MCRLAGGPISVATWHRLVATEPARPLCHRHDEVVGKSRDQSIARPVLAYRSSRNLFAADAAGRSVEIGRGGDEYEEVPFAWSGDALGWATPSQAAILPDGAAEPEVWTCGCSGAAWHGGALYSLRADGGVLLAFRPGERWPKETPVTGLDDYSPRLIGFVGDVPVVAAIKPGASAATLYAIGPDGMTVSQGDAPGGVVAVAGWPDANRLAFAAVPTHGGECLGSPAIGVVRERGTGFVITYPPLPEGGARAPHSVQSLQMAPSGAFTAAISDPGCVDFEPAAVPRPASRYRLRGGSWRATGDRGGDVQLAGGGRAVLRIERPAETGARLVLEPPGEAATVVANDVDQLSGRP
jgi:hypothetical protein